MTTPSEHAPDVAARREAGDLGTEGVELIERLIARGDEPGLLEVVARRHAADVAAVLALLTPDGRTSFVTVIGDRMPPEVLVELDDGVRRGVVADLGEEASSRLIREMRCDDAVSVLEDLPSALANRILNRIPIPQRALLKRVLAYPEDSAGRIMRPEFVAVPSSRTVAWTIDLLRRSARIPDDFGMLFVIDDAHAPVGTVRLGDLIRADGSAWMKDLADAHVMPVPVDMNRENVARMFERYNLVSAPVVDADGALVGVIAADDVFELIAEEAGKDILRLGGVGDESVVDTALSGASRRAVWLFLNLFTAALGSLVIWTFEETVEKAVALAILMPIVASTGGNAATQTLTITVRSLARRELTDVNMLRVVRRELAIGLCNGVGLSAVTGMSGGWWFGDAVLGIVLATALMINMIMAALAGILIPVGLDRIGLDPALASGVFVTAVTDVVGFFAFLGLAAIVFV